MMQFIFRHTITHNRDNVPLSNNLTSSNNCTLLLTIKCLSVIMTNSEVNVEIKSSTNDRVNTTIVKINSESNFTKNKHF